MAEIEHFVDPLDKNHERFESVKDIKLRLLPKDVQAAGKTDISELTVGEAVKSVSHAPILRDRTPELRELIKTRARRAWSTTRLSVTLSLASTSS